MAMAKRASKSRPDRRSSRRRGPNLLEFLHPTRPRAGEIEVYHPGLSQLDQLPKVMVANELLEAEATQIERRKRSTLLGVGLPRPLARLVSPREWDEEPTTPRWNPEVPDNPEVPSSPAPPTRTKRCTIPSRLLGVWYNDWRDWVG